MKVNIPRRSATDSVRAWVFSDLLATITIVLLIALIGIATANKQSAKARRIQCVSNLQKLGLASRVFATDYLDSFSTNFSGAPGLLKPPGLAAHLRALSNELQTPVILQCPSDTRKPARDFAGLTDQNISYFLGLDADETRPQSLLAGDRNLTTNGVAVGPGVISLTNNVTVGYAATMHKGSGNVAQGDGSVQDMTGARLQAAGLAQRIAIP